MTVKWENMPFHSLKAQVDEDEYSGAWLFSDIDFASGYHQVPVTEQDKMKAAFFAPPLAFLSFGRNAIWLMQCSQYKPAAGGEHDQNWGSCGTGG